MAISPDLKQIIDILDEEGFGALAGELMTEISLGSVIEKPLMGDGSADQPEETVLARIPIDEDDQVRVAMAFLRLRLVEPVRAFAEAERLASEMAGAEGVRIRFVDPVERFEIAPISSTDVIGDRTIVDRLDALLVELPSLIVPPATDLS